MRKWHRWLSAFFGIFLVWSALTGVASQVVPWFERRDAPEVVAPAPPPGFTCPEGMTCRPKRAGNSIVGLLHDLHSGESFGPVGVAVMTMAGMALLFFAGSGMWMYLQLARHRARRGLSPRWFWK